MSTNCDIDDPREHVDIRLNVKLSCVITLGVYSGPITKEIVAENIHNFIRSRASVDDTRELIDGYTVVGVLIDDEDQVVF